MVINNHNLVYNTGFVYLCFFGTVGPGIISGLDCFTCDVTKNGTVGLNPCNSSMPCDPEIEDQMCLSWISYDNRSFWVGCIEKAAAESCVFKPSIYCDE